MQIIHKNKDYNIVTTVGMLQLCIQFVTVAMSINHTRVNIRFPGMEKLRPRDIAGVYIIANQRVILYFIILNY